MIWVIAYFGISKSNRDKFKEEVNSIKSILNKHNIVLEVFVDKYEFTSKEEKEMMQIAFSEIDQCDMIIVELTKKAIGVGVEVGYAKAKSKPIVYIKKENSEYSTTVGGSADYLIEYKNKKELESKLDITINELKEKIKPNR